MCNAVLVDCKTHYRSRFVRLVLYLMGEEADKEEASRITHSAFMREWEDVKPPTLADKLRNVFLPS